MFDPLRPLKFLPWIQLLQVALVTVLLVIAADLLLAIASSNALLGNLISKLLYSPIGGFLQLGITVGVGALSVVVMERWKTIPITTATLWALVPCLALWIWLKSFLRLPSLIVPELSYETLITLILGVFWKGRRYWRWGG